MALGALAGHAKLTLTNRTVCLIESNQNGSQIVPQKEGELLH